MSGTAWPGEGMRPQTQTLLLLSSGPVLSPDKDSEPQCGSLGPGLICARHGSLVPLQRFGESWAVPWGLPGLQAAPEQPPARPGIEGSASPGSREGGGSIGDFLSPQ